MTTFELGAAEQHTPIHKATVTKFKPSMHCNFLNRSSRLPTNQDALAVSLSFFLQLTRETIVHQIIGFELGELRVAFGQQLQRALDSLFCWHNAPIIEQMDTII